MVGRGEEGPMDESDGEDDEARGAVGRGGRSHVRREMERGVQEAVRRNSSDDISCTRETARRNAKRSSSPASWRGGIVSTVPNRKKRGSGVKKRGKLTGEDGQAPERRHGRTRVDRSFLVLLPSLRLLPHGLSRTLARLIPPICLQFTRTVVRRDVGSVGRLEVLKNVAQHLLREDVPNFTGGIDCFTSTEGRVGGESGRVVVGVERTRLGGRDELGRGFVRRGIDGKVDGVGEKKVVHLRLSDKVDGD